MIMMRTKWQVLSFVVAMAMWMTTSVHAQKTTSVHKGTGGSPHVRTEWTVNGATISVEYGRPSVKGRTIGKDLEPMAWQPWRVGADEATTLKTDASLGFGNVTIPAGTYTLFVLSSEDGWKLIVNKQTG